MLINKKKQTNIQKKIKAMEASRNKNILEKEKKSIKILTKKFSLKEYNVKKKRENHIHINNNFGRIFTRSTI